MQYFDKSIARLSEGKLPKSSSVRYMVNVREEGRWTIFTDAPSKGRAITAAKSLLSEGKFDAAKVTEDRGQPQEILLWEQQSNRRRKKAVKITPVDEAAACRELADFYGFEARKTVGRLLRHYFDQEGMLPVELVHHRLNLRKLVRQNDLYIKAVQSISTVLAKSDDRNPSQVMDFIDSMVRKMTARAELADDMDDYVKMMESGGMAALIEGVNKSAPEKNRDFLIRAGLAKRTSEFGHWEGKLNLLLEQVEKDPDSKGIDYIDEFIAEIFDGSTAVMEILGYQRNLATALQTVVQLATSTYESNDDEPSVLDRLSQLMGREKMPRTQDVMIDRVTRILSGGSPLTKEETRVEEQEAFRSLMRHLLGHQLLTNSHALCEAASLRAKTVLVDEKEDESYEKAVDDMIALLPTIAVKLGYLLDLSGTEFGKKVDDHIVACLASLLAGVTTVTQLVERGASEKQIIIASAGIRDRLLATDLPDQWRQRFAKRIYDLLVGYQQGETQTSISKTANRDAHPEPEKAAGIPAAETPAAAEDSGEDKGEDGDPTQRHLTAGQYLFREGDEGNEAYLVLIGQINIIKQAGDQEIVIAQVGKGSIIGEMALIDSEPRMASAKAVTDITVTIIPADDLKMRLDRLEEFDPVMRRLVGMFVQRMRDSRFLNFDS